MWKYYIEIIKERDIDYNHQEYCLWFAGHFSYQIYPLSEYINILEQDNGDLLPISKNLTNHFYNNDVEIIINLLYHLNELSNLDFIIMDNSHISNIEKLFISRYDKLYFFNLFSFDNEILLSNNNDNSTLLYLFLYFFPNNKNHDLLYHSRKNIPLISCNKITFTHFEMLLYLMKNFNNIDYNSLCTNYNLNLFLLEDFCQSATEIYTFLEHGDWYKILPIEKMKILFNEKCSLEQFGEFKSKIVYATVPTLTNFIEYFQKELEYLQLKEKLTKKSQFHHKEKVIKI